MIQNKTIDIEAEVKAFYGHKLKRDMILIITLSIAMFIGQLSSPLINGSLSILIIVTILLIFLLINYIKNKGQQSDWIWACMYKADFPPRSPYATQLNMNLRPNLEKIFQDNSKLKKTRFGKTFKTKGD